MFTLQSDFRVYNYFYVGVIWGESSLFMYHLLSMARIRRINDLAPLFDWREVDAQELERRQLLVADERVRVVGAHRGRAAEWRGGLGGGPGGPGGSCGAMGRKGPWLGLKKFKVMQIM